MNADDVDVTFASPMSISDMLRLIRDLQERVLILEGRKLRENTIGPHVKGSATSKQAAVHNFPRSASQRGRILTLLMDLGDRGATRQELADELGLSDDSVRPRVVELVQGGWVAISNLTRRTRLGEESEVLLASAKAFAERDLKVEETRAIVSPEVPPSPPLPDAETSLFELPPVPHYRHDAA